jgi:hypothetical protein
MVTAHWLWATEVMFQGIEVEVEKKKFSQKPVDHRAIW